MMAGRGFRHAVAWTAIIVFCLIALHFVHRLRWPAAQDIYTEAARGAEAVRPFINADSVTGFAVQGLPDDLYLYIRYRLIPARMDMQILPGRRTLLIVSGARLAKVVADFEALHAVRHELLRQWNGANIIIRVYQL